MAAKRLMSGIRPTGPLHVGNYVGALRQWASLQSDYECFYVVVDWHALMSEYKTPAEVGKHVYTVLAELMACGITPERSTLIRQSDVPEHLELMMILGNLMSLGRLQRCPTYKEQLRELASKEVTNYTFLGYPVLQAADILVYRGEVVPVGEDQLPHLEITRELARKFNALYGDLFPEPQPLLERVARLPGLDGRKMSKSYGNAVYLADPPEEIRRKVMSALTDTKRARRADPGHPDECNLYPYYKALFPETAAALRSDCEESRLGCVDCKKRLSGLLVEFLEPIRRKREALLSDRSRLDEVLKEGAEKARSVAGGTMRAVRGQMGLF